MGPAAQTAVGAGAAEAAPAGGVLRCGGRSVTGGTETHARIANDIARQGARRIGTLAILTAVTVVGAAILQAALQPEMAAAQQIGNHRLLCQRVAILARDGAGGLASRPDLGQAAEASRTQHV